MISTELCPAPAPAALSPRRARLLHARSARSRRQIVLLASVHAGALAALFTPSRRGAAWALGLYLVTGLSISLGYHRLLSHGAFRAPRWLRTGLAAVATLALQGGPITWVGFHRAHHRHTDAEGDPHSAARGLFWSHVGWALHKGPNGYRRQKMRGLTAALERDPALRALERHHFLLNAGAFGLAFVLLGPAVALWAFPLRIALLWHVTWLTNSVAHGAHLPRVERAPRDIRWLSLIGFGEGLHASHHAHPSRPRFACSRGAIDPGGWVLAALGALGIIDMRRD